MAFNIRYYVNFDKHGRGDCPCCLNMGYKPGEKTLSLMDNGAYHCYRDPDHKGDVMKAVVGYTSDRDVPEHLRKKVFKKVDTSQKKPATLYEIDKVEEAKAKLLNPSDESERKALEWVLNRGFTPEMVEHYGIGYGWTTITDDKDQKYWLSGVAIFIPTDEEGKYYRKLRVAPWVPSEEQPSYYRKWSQAGIPSHIWLPYNPPNAQRTFMCEGEWDGMALAWLARQERADFAVACSTTGAGTVPGADQLLKLPGEVITFYDRNDPPSKATGKRPGDEGALKLVLALEGRGRIGEVPCSEESLDKQGWDVSNSINEGHTIADFQVAAFLARLPDEVQELQKAQNVAVNATTIRESVEEKALEPDGVTLDLVSNAEVIGNTPLDHATQSETSAWQAVRQSSLEAYQSHCPEPVKYNVASDIGDAMRTLYQMISTHSPDLAFFLPTQQMEENTPNPSLRTIQAWFTVCQAMATPSDQLDHIQRVHDLMESGEALPPGTLDDIQRDWSAYQQNLSSLVKNARYILDTKGQADPSTGDRVYPGKTYEIRETPDQLMVLSHNERGSLLEMTPDEVLSCHFTDRDVQLFALQAQRIEQTLEAPSMVLQVPATPTPRRELEQG